MIEISSERPSRSPDHSRKDASNSGSTLFVSRCHVSLLHVVSSAETAPVRTLSMVIGAGGSAVTGARKGFLRAAWLIEAAVARYQASRGVGGAAVGSGRESKVVVEKRPEVLRCR